MANIRGAFGGDSGGGGGGISEEPDTLSSVAFARFVDLIGEGPIVGLVNGDHSIYLDGVSLLNVEGTPNYRPFLSRTTVGTQSQAPIPGFTGTVQETAVSLKLFFSGGKIIRPIPDPGADAVRVTVGVQGLSQTSADGKIGPANVEFQISIRLTGGSWVVAYKGAISGKTNSRYQRSHEVSLTGLGPGPYQVAVERITADSVSGLLVDSIYWDSYAVLNYERFSYPNSALVAVEVDGRYFSSVPARTYHVKGLIVRVPVNYNPVTRKYQGIWNGTFKLAYTNNPAWCFFDLVTHKRYGLGKRISDAQISKWVIYEIAKFCDEGVPTGTTTNIFSTKSNTNFSSSGQIAAGIPVRDKRTEPRFTLNCVINTKEDAYKVLAQLSSVFRGMTYWASGMVTLTQDRPTTPRPQWTNANVVDGMFTYEGSARMDRHTTAVVGWNDPAEDFRQKFEYIEDKEGILRYGVRPIETIAFGCTSRSQARRVGLWMLYTERVEKDAIRFRAGLDSARVMPGEVGKIMDTNRTGARWGGRVISATTSVITIDAPVTLVAGTYTLSMVLIDGTLAEKAVNIATNGVYSTLTVAIAFGVAPAVMAIWTLASTTIVPMLARVISITPVGPSEFDIVCLEHNPSKYAAIELGAAYVQYDYSFLSFNVVPPITNLTAVENSFKTSVSASVQTNVEVGWDAISDPLVRGYRLKSTSLAGSVVNYPEQRDSFYTMLGVTPDTYTFSVSAINVLGIVGPVSSVTLVVQGIDLTPPANVTGFVSVVVRDGVRFTWNPNTAVDYLETELHLEAVWNPATVPMFVGRASTYTLASPPSGVYNVLAKHRDTSGNVSVIAASVNDTVPVYVPPSNGTDGVSFVLSNEAHTVASDVFGNVPSFAGADSYISAYVGGVNSTNLWTYTKVDKNLHSYFEPGIPNHVIVDAMGGTALLIHAAQAPGTYAPIDSSPFAHPLINPGTDVTLTAANAKFDQALQFQGTENGFLEVVYGNEMILGSSDFALQMQAYLPALGSRRFLAGWWGAGTDTTKHSWALLVGASGALSFDYASLLDVADYTISSSALIPSGVVTEIGVSRNGNVLSLKVGASVQSFPFDKTIRTIVGNFEGDTTSTPTYPVAVPNPDLPGAQLTIAGGFGYTQGVVASAPACYVNVDNAGSIFSNNQGNVAFDVVFPEAYFWYPVTPSHSATHVKVNLISGTITGGTLVNGVWAPTSGGKAVGLVGSGSAGTQNLVFTLSFSTNGGTTTYATSGVFDITLKST